jgi:hypothetical protein
MVTRLCPSNIPNQDTQKVIELNILNHLQTKQSSLEQIFVKLVH